MEKFADIVINRKSRAVDRLFTYSIPPQLQQQLAVGMSVRVPFNREQLEGVVVAVHQQPPDGFAVRAISGLLADKPLFTGELLALAAWMSDYYLCPKAAVLQAMLPAGLHLSGQLPRPFYRDRYYAADPPPERMTAKRRQLYDYLLAHAGAEREQLLAAGFSPSLLKAAEVACCVYKRRLRIEDGAATAEAEAGQLNAQQQQAYRRIREEWQGQNRPFLLHGVTGSGKTEIYLRLIQDIIAAGRQAIVLVPEIALSQQMLTMLSRRLEQPVAVLHSGLGAAERRLIWQDIAAGKYAVVVGARSALFAPLPRLGLIVIDEEHESSYKQENAPRFHALRTARERARLSGARLLLGSATPSVESYYYAEQGEYALGELSEQYHAASPPRIEVVDMRAELRAGNRSIFSAALIGALQGTLEAGEQAMLFLNRRGYYQFYSCRECGGSISCDHCAVAMSFHQDARGGQLKCHYCGRVIAPPKLCPTCGSPHIRHFGVGTQRVVEEAQRLFPEARIARLDSDVMEKKGEHQRIYKGMMRHDYDILVGTQMIAKGLDFPEVQLAAVIAADTMLNLPDWRASERAFQLIGQLCGRAGRRERQGRAIIQTYTPQAIAVAAAAERDYRRFYEQELRERRLHGYPPYARLVRLLFTASERGPLMEAAKAYAFLLRPLLGEHSELCGPAEAPFAKIKDRWRWQILLKSSDFTALRPALLQAEQQWRGNYRLPADILMIVDIDPMSMM
ncbi:MAG: primosomal protein N' [Bacillota bacterium]|nr:primosomal protein N' [Bacillota bacterium]